MFYSFTGSPKIKPSKQVQNPSKSVLKNTSDDANTFRPIDPPPPPPPAIAELYCNRYAFKVRRSQHSVTGSGINTNKAARSPVHRLKRWGKIQEKDSDSSVSTNDSFSCSLPLDVFGDESKESDWSLYDHMQGSESSNQIDAMPTIDSEWLRQIESHSSQKPINQINSHFTGDMKWTNQIDSRASGDLKWTNQMGWKQTNHTLSPKKEKYPEKLKKCENEEENKQKRVDAFLDLLSRRFPNKDTHPDKATPESIKSNKPPSKLPRKARNRNRNDARSKTTVVTYTPGKLGHPSTIEHAGNETMSDPETEQGEVVVDRRFQRGGRLRASMPIVRSLNQSFEQPIGLVFLVYGDETKRAVLPNEITQLDTVRALFVRSFPDKLSMKLLENPKQKIYILDPVTNIYYQIEDLREIKNQSVLKIHDSDSFQPQFVKNCVDLRGKVCHYGIVQKSPIERSLSCRERRKEMARPSTAKEGVYVTAAVRKGSRTDFDEKKQIQTDGTYTEIGPVYARCDDMRGRSGSDPCSPNVLSPERPFSPDPRVSLGTIPENHQAIMNQRSRSLPPQRESDYASAIKYHGYVETDIDTGYQYRTSPPPVPPARHNSLSNQQQQQHPQQQQQQQQQQQNTPVMDSWSQVYMNRQPYYISNNYKHSVIYPANYAYVQSPVHSSAGYQHPQHAHGSRKSPIPASIQQQQHHVISHNAQSSSNSSTPVSSQSSPVANPQQQMYASVNPRARSASPGMQKVEASGNYARVRGPHGDGRVSPHRRQAPSRPDGVSPRSGDVPNTRHSLSFTPMGGGGGGGGGGGSGHPQQQHPQQQQQAQQQPAMYRTQSYRMPNERPREKPQLERARSETPQMYDPETCQRMDTMEAQLASLTAWVQDTVTQTPFGGSLGNVRSPGERAGSEARSDSSGSTLSAKSQPNIATAVSFSDNRSRGVPETHHFKTHRQTQTCVQTSVQTGGQPAVQPDIRGNIVKLMKKTRELKMGLRHIRHQQQVNIEETRETLQLAMKTIKTVIAHTPGANDQVIRQQRFETELILAAFCQDEQRVMKELADLESSVDELKSDVVNRYCNVSMHDIEGMALALSHVTKGLADLKMRFPVLQDQMKRVMSGEMEIVVNEEKCGGISAAALPLFLRDEPDKIESSLRKCKKLTGTLFTLKKLAAVQEKRSPQIPVIHTNTDPSGETKQAVLDSIQAVLPDHDARIQSIQATDASRERKKRLSSQTEALKFEKTLEIASKNLKSSETVDGTKVFPKAQPVPAKRSSSRSPPPKPDRKSASPPPKPERKAVARSPPLLHLASNEVKQDGAQRSKLSEMAVVAPLAETEDEKLPHENNGFDSAGEQILIAAAERTQRSRKRDSREVRIMEPVVEIDERMTNGFYTSESSLDDSLRIVEGSSSEQMTNSQESMSDIEFKPMRKSLALQKQAARAEFFKDMSPPAISRKPSAKDTDWSLKLVKLQPSPRSPVRTSPPEKEIGKRWTNTPAVTFTNHISSSSTSLSSSLASSESKLVKSNKSPKSEESRIPMFRYSVPNVSILHDKDGKPDLGRISPDKPLKSILVNSKNKATAPVPPARKQNRFSLPDSPGVSFSSEVASPIRPGISLVNNVNESQTIADASDKRDTPIIITYTKEFSCPITSSTPVRESSCSGGNCPQESPVPAYTNSPSSPNDIKSKANQLESNMTNLNSHLLNTIQEDDRNSLSSQGDSKNSNTGSASSIDSYKSPNLKLTKQPEAPVTVSIVTGCLDQNNVINVNSNKSNPNSPRKSNPSSPTKSEMNVNLTFGQSPSPNKKGKKVPPPPPIRKSSILSNGVAGNTDITVLNRENHNGFSKRKD